MCGTSGRNPPGPRRSRTRTLRSHPGLRRYSRRPEPGRVREHHCSASLGHAQARSLGPEGILDYGFMLTLHRRMFGDVWSWAGTLRRRVTSIGVEPHLIAEQSRQLLDDAKFWHAEAVFGYDELAVRIHCRLAIVHPFPNGNGRCTRMMADLYLVAIGREPSPGVAQASTSTAQSAPAYIAALVKAAPARLLRPDSVRPRPDGHLTSFHHDQRSSSRASMTYIGSVSDFGLIVGTYVDANGNAHGSFSVMAGTRRSTTRSPSQGHDCLQLQQPRNGRRLLRCERRVNERVRKRRPVTSVSGGSEETGPRAPLLRP